MDARLGYREEGTRLERMGRWFTTLAMLLFVAGWVTVVWATLTTTGDRFVIWNEALQIVQIGGSVTLACAGLGLLGVAMRAYGVWLQIPGPRD
jgi:hypothetical protein